VKTVNESREELDKEKEDAREEGMEDGIDKGKIIGGIFAKQEEKLEIAKNLLNMNMDMETIMKATGLTRIDIDAIGTQSEN